MTNEIDPYRQLQEHLDKMPIGYPATQSGVEINLLKTIFTPEQAGLVTHLDYKYKSIPEIFEKVKNNRKFRRRINQLAGRNSGKRWH